MTVSDRIDFLTPHLRAGTGTAWLFPFVDGAPPVGWEDAARYLALPIALVAAQFASSAVISPPIDDEDKNAAFSKGLLIAVPFMVGWFALNVPSGLSLYYFSNTIITSGIQIWLRKLGGAYSPLLLLILSPADCARLLVLSLLSQAGIWLRILVSGPRQALVHLLGKAGLLRLAVLVICSFSRL